MPRSCNVCSHERRDDIDKSLVEGVSLSSIWEAYGITEDSLARHRDNHLSATLVQAYEAREIARGEDLLTQMKDLQAITLRTLKAAEEAGEYKTVLSAVREARNNLAYLSQLAAQLERTQAPSDSGESSPQWIEMRSMILKALEAYPDARLAVVEALGNGHPKD